MEVVIRSYILNPENTEKVVQLILDYYSTDVRIGGETENVVKQLEELGETKVLEQFEKGFFSC